MMTVTNYNSYAEQLPIPEWIHAERYEYCENFFVQEKHFTFSMLAQKIRSFFS